MQKHISRWQFLAAAFGFGSVASAQQVVVPKNNECPRCGELANPNQYGLITSVRGVRVGVPSADESYEMIIRCGKCNSAFWRDSEK